MANTASNEQAAIMSVGMPLLTPYPLSDKLSIDGTTTAGDTTANTNLQVETKYQTCVMM